VTDLVAEHVLPVVSRKRLAVCILYAHPEEWSGGCACIVQVRLFDLSAASFKGEWDWEGWDEDVSLEEQQLARRKGWNEDVGLEEQQLARISQLLEEMRGSRQLVTS
jgi:hypothetical protein